ncbi:histidine phosphatase family protein [Mycolicibacterium hodleri]|uniref:Histidine phosphatase family protein n=1 Tax=Mycolicibacterium hodleri TaxID=49897 RepID=A0A502E9P3_9MYCO|nr:histidine phosphatase family protein [Mycolicibacterium hodleri]TPG34438.1 histidine phosphatase family protein [Mycolicibacterium hodleri]
MKRWIAAITVTLTIAAVAVAPTAPAAPERDITLTFIRHAQSTGNTSGYIDTSTPGPGLTELGWQQAHQVAADYADDGFDGIFASTMTRTQQTAEFLAEELHDPVDVLPGLREIEAGIYEGQPEFTGVAFYAALKQWVHGDRNARIPGSIDGNEFDARFDDAVAAIYATGDRKPVAFSHGAAIALWTLMNTTNADPALLETEPLNNTGYVVVRGNPSAGWTLVDWNGVRV